MNGTRRKTSTPFRRPTDADLGRRRSPDPTRRKASCKDASSTVGLRRVFGPYINPWDSYGWVMQDVSALSTRRRWLVLPIESNVRELQARTLLAAVAAERGFGVLMGRQSELPRYLPALPPAVVLQMNAISTHVFDIAQRDNHVVTALDEEGLVYRNQEDYLRRRISVSALERCVRFFAWGDVHRAAVASKAPQLAERILSIGNPRIDLLRPGIREIFRQEAEALSERYGRFVLLNSNFGTYNHSLGSDYVARMWAASGWTNNRESAELLRHTIEFQRRLFDEFVELVQALASALPPEVGIVLRPHPSERHESWQARLGHIESFKLIYEGAVVPWLLAAEALVHNSCTTGIEAALLERPSFAFLPFRDRSVECVLPNDVSDAIESREDLLDSVLEVVRGVHHAQHHPVDVLSKHIAYLMGPLASDAIVDELERVAPPPNPLKNGQTMPARIRFGRAMLQARSFLSAARRRDLRGERNLAAFVRRASPGISHEEVRQVLDGLSAATGRFRRVACASLAPDVVIIGELADGDGAGYPELAQATKAT